MASEIDTVGQAFVKHYYTLFDTNRAQLMGLYKNESIMSYEGEYCAGSQMIMTKLANLKFQTVKHEVKSVDCQPSGCGGIVIFVTGELKVDNETNPVKYSQVFHLLQDQSSQGNYWLHNDIFRLNWG